VDDSCQTALDLDATGVRVAAVIQARAASLRYFDQGGSFGRALEQALGEPLPRTQRAALAAPGRDAEMLLAWRSPTETLLLCRSAAAFAELEQRLAGAGDGYMVDQTGGICVFRVEGERAAEFLQRFAASTAIPAVGEARGGRMADLHVLTACVQAGEFLVFVERVYAAHLADWMRATTADFG
jgi:heterotetrameric sarcosine oxidase gamma subunit